MKTYYTVYKTTNKINGKTYIGCHQTTNLMDGYMGSGKLLRRAIKKYEIDNFKKEILEIYDNPEDMFMCESTMVDEKFVDDSETYNLKEGGSGGWNRFNRNSDMQRSKGKKSNLKQKILRETDPKWVEHRSIALSAALKAGYASGRRSVSTPDWTGKSHTDETKRKQSEAKTGMYIGASNPMYGTMWIHNLELKKSIRIKKLDPIPDGWLIGRKMKF